MKNAQDIFEAQHNEIFSQGSKRRQTRKLGDMCEIIPGQSPEGKFYNSNGHGMPFYQGKKDFGERVLKNPTSWTTQITKIAKKDDILMSVRAPVGPINFATEEICIGRGLAAIRCGVELNRDFLFYQLLYLQRELMGKEGAVFASINKSQIEALRIEFVPLSEQNRIVTLLDSAFFALEKAKTNTEQNLKNAREVFETYLDQIFSQDHPSWNEHNLQSLTTKIGSGATPLGGEKAYHTKGISLIRSLNVYDYGFRFQDLAFINEIQANQLSNVNVCPDDVLLNITGASVARCCIVPTEVLPARVNQHVSIIRPINTKILSSFLHYLLTSKFYKNRLLQVGDSGGSTRQAITKAELQCFRIKYPAILVEQQSIVDNLNVLSTKIKQLESIYQRKFAALEELKKSILARAFNGEL